MSKKVLEDGRAVLGDDTPAEDELKIDIDAYAANIDGNPVVYVEFREVEHGIIAEFTARETLEKFIKALQEAAEHAFGKMPG